MAGEHIFTKALTGVIFEKHRSRSLGERRKASTEVAKDNKCKPGFSLLRSLTYPHHFNEQILTLDTDTRNDINRVSLLRLYFLRSWYGAADYCLWT